MNRENAVPQLHFVSTSSASDGSFVAIAEIGSLLGDEPHRLIGGVAVVLHQHRLGIDHPIRATADADFGVPPYALKDDSLVDSVASLGYQRTSGNRWVRALSDQRSATVDLLVPSYRTRLRSSVQHGSTNTIEVGGLAEALQRDPVPVSATVALTDGELITLDVLLPDLASLLGLKLHARRVRQVDRDAIDLWTCLEHSSDQLTEQTFEFDNPNMSGAPLIFLVEDLNDLQAIKVMLPTRPNGSFGWINADQVRLTRHNYSIQVRLDDFAITVTDHEKTIFETTVGVARESTPTPRGRYYTTELLRPPESDTAYGPYAYGLSGYSDTFESFLGGPGQLGIHGTNEPWALGTNVSSGCVRLHNDDITYLVETLQLPLGVPVDII